MPLVPTIWNRGAASFWKIGMSSSWSDLIHLQKSLFRFHFIAMDWSETVWARTPSEFRVAAPLNFWRSVSRSYVRQSIVGPYVTKQQSYSYRRTLFCMHVGFRVAWQPGLCTTLRRDGSNLAGFFRVLRAGWVPLAFLVLKMGRNGNFEKMWKNSLYLEHCIMNVRSMAYQTDP